jgi:DNA sulfur modification protein DndE
MKLNLIKFETKASNDLKALKARTGITPNLLCRIGFCLSVEDVSALDPDAFPADSDRIIERHVLLGSYDTLFVAMMKERVHQDGLDPHDNELLGKYFRAHVHRGIHLLIKRVKTFADLARVIAKPQLVASEPV